MKKTISNQGNKIWTSALCLLLVVALLCVLFDCKAIMASALSDETVITLNEEFDYDSVIAIIDNDKNDSDNIYNSLMNSGIGIESIYDLTVNNKDAKSGESRQILQIDLKVKSRDNILKAIILLSKMDYVISAEPNYKLRPATEPNDTYYSQNWLWGLNGDNGIGMPLAWNMTQGSKSVRVGVIDTGIASHVDLNANLTTGWDTYNNDSTTMDDTDSHGTHVAGTIGAVGNNNEGVVGVNWNVTLVPLQASNENNLFGVTEIVRAIQWAENKWGTDEQIDIINYSAEGFCCAPAVLEAIRNYHGLFVWAAGNSGFDVDNYVDSSLYNLPNLISVGAIDRNGQKRDSSNYGKKTVDIFAPGESIVSTMPHDRYGEKSGTSMAAPHVTGVAALLLAKYPDLTPSQIKAAILNNVDKDSNLSNLCVSGGRLNAYKALNSLHFSHDYTYEYQFVDTEQHKEICACDDYISASHNYSYKRIDGVQHTAVCKCSQRTEPHTVLGGWDSNKINRCMFCGAIVEMGQIIFPNSVALPMTDNGSYILPNGVTVLMLEDLEAYLNGTLEFNSNRHQSVA